MTPANDYRYHNRLLALCFALVHIGLPEYIFLSGAVQDESENDESENANWAGGRSSEKDVVKSPKGAVLQERLVAGRR